MDRKWRSRPGFIEVTSDSMDFLRDAISRNGISRFLLLNTPGRGESRSMFSLGSGVGCMMVELASPVSAGPDCALCVYFELGPGYSIKICLI